MANNESPVGANLLVGKGELYFDRWTGQTASTATGERFLGNVEAIDIQTTDTLKDKYSSVSAAAPLIAEALTQRIVELTITMNEATRQNLALALMGSEGGFAQTAGTVTAQAFVCPTLGTWISVGARNISAVAVKKGATVYSAVTDYAVDLVTGRIKPLVGGTMVAGDADTVDYTRAVITAPGLDQVNIGVSSRIEGLLRFVAFPAAGPAWDLEIWHVLLTPDGTLGFIQQDFNTWKMKARILDDSANHATTPLGRAIRTS